MHPHPRRVEEAIKAHRIAVEADEASFDEIGNAISVELEQATGNAEIEAYKAFVALPCQTPADVQAKLTHMLNGSAGDRLKFIECLTEVCYGEPLEQFLRSLLVEGSK